MTSLNLGGGLVVPADAVCQTFGILAVRGAGKSNTAAVMAEEMFAAGLPFCVVDPIGAWYGLRSSADGKAAGLPIPIFGGKRGDVPLERGAGDLIADLVVDKRLTCILDLSEFESEGDKRAFLLAFARRLYRRNEDPLHLFLEEADDYIPQKPMREEAQLLRAWENIVRRGRGRGLGVTLITQRSAAVSKMVLTQVETLFAMRTTAPQDIKAIKAWIQYHQVDEDVLATLSALADGEAWVWSPHFLKRMSRHQIRRRRTFDSGATPQNVRAGASRRAATLADIELPAIRAAMADTIQRAESEDPKILRRRVAELERQLRERVAPAPAKIERVEVPAVDANTLARIESVVKSVDVLIERHRETAGVLGKALGTAVADLLDAVVAVKSPSARVTVPATATLTRVGGEKIQLPRLVYGGDVPKLRAGARRILSALASRHPLRWTESQVATLAGMTRSGGTFQQYVGDLRRLGLVERDGGEYTITPAGLACAGDRVEPTPQNTADAVAMWKAKLRRGEGEILDALVGVYPMGLAPEALGDRCGKAWNGGTFQQYVGTLRRNGLVERDHGGALRASKSLMTVGV